MRDEHGTLPDDDVERYQMLAETGLQILYEQALENDDVARFHLRWIATQLKHMMALDEQIKQAKRAGEFEKATRH